MSDKLETAKIQSGLHGLGYSPGDVDGIFGPNTKKAAEEWIHNGGKRKSASVSEPPWVTLAKKKLGLHEKLNNQALKDFLKSDGHALGDPAVLPWCADFVETCIRLALPDEPFPPVLEENPYWAKNWAHFGISDAHNPSYGSIGVFERKPSGGHVGFLVGKTETTYQVLGGNQNNMVSVVHIAKSRIITCRWPSTYKNSLFDSLPTVKAGSLSMNES